MWRSTALLVAVFAVACMVPDVNLDGKSCPCVDGYACDQNTNQCVRDPVDAPVDDDGPHDDASPTASCFADPTGALLYGTAFTQGNLQWTEPIGDWGITGGEARQSDAALPLAYAYPDQTALESTYRVSAKLRQVSGTATDSVGIVLRAQTASTGHYSCDWEPNTGNFAMHHTTTDGTLVTPITSVVVDIDAIPGYTAADPQVIDAEAEATRLECCIRGMPTARLLGDDNRYTTGGPGFRTSSMSAAYDDLAINAL